MIYIVFVLAFLFAVYLYDKLQVKHTITRNFPIIGWTRYFAEWARPKVRQYFVESDTDGVPVSRNRRSLVYRRAKGDTDTVPFGTTVKLYDVGAEWLSNSEVPLNPRDVKFKNTVFIGSVDSPGGLYELPIINSSAMSFGALSPEAVMAMSKGAKAGGFVLNTGEGGLSKYHTYGGCDIAYQLGTGYFGSRTPDGSFSIEKYKNVVSEQQVKYTEIKISQGAKPGHGGILPAIKNTDEIAAIRGVEPNTTIYSPPAHTAFSGFEDMLHFIYELKCASKKPVGIKICFGSFAQIDSLCRTMRLTKNWHYLPDFVTVDGAEGGTGAAPVEFTDNVGMPLFDALPYFHKALTREGIRDRLKIVASGGIISGFDVIKARACGADSVNMARAMMFALGCIHALECNKNTCPVGITTQNPRLRRGLVVDEKAKRVASYYHKTVDAVKELCCAAGVSTLEEITPNMVFRRTADGKVKNFTQIYFID